jgi:hypothetical protein
MSDIPNSPPTPNRSAVVVMRHFASPNIAPDYATKVDSCWHKIAAAQARLGEMVRDVQGSALGLMVQVEMDGFTLVDMGGTVVERVWLERVRVDGCLVEWL